MRWLTGHLRRGAQCGMAMVGKVDRSRMRRACRGALAVATELRRENQSGMATTTEIIQTGQNIRPAAVAEAGQVGPGTQGPIARRAPISRYCVVGVVHTPLD